MQSTSSFRDAPDRRVVSSPSSSTDNPTNRLNHGSPIVCYSLTFAEPGRQEASNHASLLRQLEISLSSLRHYNSQIRVMLFCHGAVPEALQSLCQRFALELRTACHYEQLLADQCPQGWQALARYPLLHKYLNFSALTACDATQILCCDCDTLFFNDVGVLLQRYASRASIVAREEVHSRRSAYGYDPGFIHEDVLQTMASRLGIRSVPPFNLGFVLFNQQQWRHMAALESLFVDYAWRFVSWMALHPLSHNARYVEFQGLQQARSCLSEQDVARALPFPSSNRWILDEVALWMTLGHIPDLTTADFSTSDVAQNGEFEHRIHGWTSCTACHYFSSNLDRVEAWLSHQAQVSRSINAPEVITHGG